MLILKDCPFKVMFMSFYFCKLVLIINVLNGRPDLSVHITVPVLFTRGRINISTYYYISGSTQGESLLLNTVILKMSTRIRKLEQFLPSVGWIFASAVGSQTNFRHFSFSSMLAIRDLKLTQKFKHLCARGWLQQVKQLLNILFFVT
jgi:hypothetical protein